MSTVTDLMRRVVRGNGFRASGSDREFIAGYTFPMGLLDRALQRCPEGVTADVLDAGLRQFFLAAAADPDLRASMPSRVVDEAWHEFITFTRPYEQFCAQAFGRFLHHQPEYLMEPEEAKANGTTVLWRTWRTACLYAGLDPDTTTDAPVLFAADVDAHLDGARRYVATCGSERGCRTAAGVVCVRHELSGATLEPTLPRARRRAERRGRAAGSWAPAGGGITCLGGGGHGGGGHGGCGGSGCGGGGCGS